MASSEKMANSTMNMVANTIMENNIENFTSLNGSPLQALLTMSIGGFFNFNALNHGIMEHNMVRNIEKKNQLLANSGVNAYDNGNPDLMSEQPQEPSYTNGDNYIEFVKAYTSAKAAGKLTTTTTAPSGGSAPSNIFNKKNLYLDDNGNGFGDALYSGTVSFSDNEFVDRNSILYKTKKLIEANKIKTIVSAFHTNGIDDPDSVRDETFDQSHGRNLLTKSAETGKGAYSRNGYDNPYCRVWTHHYQYDKLAKTMRANSGGINTWKGFEWDNTDEGHTEDNTVYGDGENYDYAWRGHHNQTRRWKHSVLDPNTGLVKITPQYRGGGEVNRHTKECMFSIENLAWKDYDPYSFEQALSWEQRGPLGGRIMWFPPYGLTVNETASAQWNSNDFIGRGEKVYTYVNSERSGNLSFIMLTDHPSSIDYASWWDDNPMIAGIDSEGNSENDYLRYFAGCMDGDNKGGGLQAADSGNTTDMPGDNLIKKPTPYTDEYLQGNPPLIKAEEIDPKSPPKDNAPKDEKNTIKIGFFVCYPNNYSGVIDAPTNEASAVNAIAYLLAGRNAQKNNAVGDDNMLTPDSDFSYRDDSGFIGYEMSKLRNDGKNTSPYRGITTSDCVEKGEFIPRGVSKDPSMPFTWDKKLRWQYRIDHKLLSKANENGYKYINDDSVKGNNKVHEKLRDINYLDENSYGFNAIPPADNIIDEEVKKYINDTFGESPITLYSFAEIAAALYSKDFLNKPKFYDYLLWNIGTNNRVENLIELFKDNQFLGGTCIGFATRQGYPQKNEELANNRSATVVKWLSENGWTVTNSGHHVLEGKKDVSAANSKLYRSAYCVLEFGTATTKSVTQADTSPEKKESEDFPIYEAKGYKGFKYIKSEAKGDGIIWNYYKKDGTVNYYEQEAKSKNNYEEPGDNDIVVTEQQVLDLFDMFPPTKRNIMKKNPAYRGAYADDGCYVTIFNYEKSDTAPHTGDNEKYLEKYSIDDYVTNGGVYYKSKTDFRVKYPTYSFNVGDWTRLTPDNISDYLYKSYHFISEVSPEGYSINDIIYTNSTFFLCVGYKDTSEVDGASAYDPTDVRFYEWSEDLTRALKGLVYNVQINPSGEFNGEYSYIEGQLCKKSGGYYKCDVPSESQTRQPIPFSTDDWIDVTERETNFYTISWELADLAEKIAAVLCWTVDRVIGVLTKGAEYLLEETKGDQSSIWKYGKTKDLVTPTTVNQNTDLVNYVTVSAQDRDKFALTSEEQNYIGAMLSEGLIDSDIAQLKKYIVAQRVLDGITKIHTNSGDRNVCSRAAANDEEMKAKTERIDESETPGCDNLWVDRGDGLLIQECNIKSEGIISRFNAETGKGDWNKLRYDQEYHFYKQYMAEHPLVFDKLQEKIKYFNPAFHSMTPEGFNARCTFLQQCTRQGNTKTMSDKGGKTANNLAFGRPPYCVLRLGDFYNQLIVIDNISFDYNISNGLQWDLNTEGNGVQPMLCQVNISFKFIGGGDITGPVQRLQNAMSFNYYANTSFYDNRADRVEYQDTNWKTMGGAGNNQVNYEKSYAFIAQNYEPNQQPNIVK